MLQVNFQLFLKNKSALKSPKLHGVDGALQTRVRCKYTCPK